MSNPSDLLISPWQALQKDLARQFAPSIHALQGSVEKPVSQSAVGISWLLRARTRAVGAHRSHR